MIGWRCVGFLVWLSIGAWLGPAAANDRGFPFGREMILDATPMPGSKRMPILEIEENGAASIDLWCARLHGQASVSNDTISIVPRTAAAGVLRAGAANRR